MAKNEKDIIYKCPCCFNRFIDVVIDKDENGVYHCLKCGFNGTVDEVKAGYDSFRKRYKLNSTRMDLETQRRR